MNWKEYDEKFVRRGELLLDLEFLKTWDSDISKMNREKTGRPYSYPNSFFQFLGVLRVLFNQPFRHAEGFVRILNKLVPNLEKPDHATIHRRVSKLNLNLADSLRNSKEPVIIALDASGVRVTNRGNWIRKKWGERKGYLNVHFAIDIETKEVKAFEVAAGETGDNLADNASGGAYDSINSLREKVKHRYSVRSGARSWAGGSWKNAAGYGQRQTAETAFSGFKRAFGGFARARKKEKHGKRDDLRGIHMQLTNQPVKSDDDRGG